MHVTNYFLYAIICLKWNTRLNLGDYMKMRKPKRLLAVLLSVLVVAELIVSVILGTVAESDGGAEPTTKSVTRQLIDFSNTSVATDIKDTAWPTGISKMDYEYYEYSSKFSVDIAEDTDGEKWSKWTKEDLSTQTKLDVVLFFSPPEILYNKNSKYD